VAAIYAIITYTGVSNNSTLTLTIGLINVLLLFINIIGFNLLFATFKDMKVNENVKGCSRFLYDRVRIVVPKKSGKEADYATQEDCLYEHAGPEDFEKALNRRDASGDYSTSQNRDNADTYNNLAGL
jgi:hypothetical protein